MNDPMKTVETVYKSEDMRIVRVGARIVLMSRFGWALSYTKKDWDQCLKEMEKADSELSIIWKLHDCFLDKYVYAASVSCEHCNTQKYLARLNRDYVVVLQKVVKDWNTRRYVP